MELIYLWVGQYKKFVNQGFVFNKNFECNFDMEQLLLTVDEKNHQRLNLFQSKTFLQINGIIGENGQGKSSILELLLYFADDLGNSEESNFTRELKEDCQLLYLFKEGGKYRLFNYTSREVQIVSKQVSEVCIYRDSLPSDKIFFLHFNIGPDKVGNRGNRLENGYGHKIKDKNFVLLPDKTDNLADSMDKQLTSLVVDVELGKQDLELNDFFKPTHFLLRLVEKKLVIRGNEVAKIWDNLQKEYGSDELRDFSTTVNTAKEFAHFLNNQLYQKLDTFDEDQFWEWLDWSCFVYRFCLHLRIFLVPTENPKDERFQKEFILSFILEGIVKTQGNIPQSLVKSFYSFSHDLKNTFGDTELRTRVESPDFLTSPERIKPAEIKELEKLRGFHEAFNSNSNRLSFTKQDRFVWKCQKEQFLFHKLGIPGILPNNFDYDFLELNEGSTPKYFSGLSGGERALYYQYLMIQRQLREVLEHRGSGTTVFLLMDEPDLGLHPEWQRKYIDLMHRTLGVHGVKIQMILATHSPFVISDLPAQNIIYLKEFKEKFSNQKTFGQNLYSLLESSFFLSSPQGEFAKQQLERFTTPFRSYHSAKAQLSALSSILEQEGLEESFRKELELQKHRLNEERFRLLTSFFEEDASLGTTPYNYYFRLKEEVGEPFLAKSLHSGLSQLKKDKNNIMSDRIEPISDQEPVVSEPIPVRRTDTGGETA